MQHSVSLGNTVIKRAPFFLSANERARHIYTIGRTGSGKSTFQRSVILQDIHAGRGVCMIDPHGDNAEAIADSIPRHRINDTIYFDAGDRAHPIALNLFGDVAGIDEADLVASEVLTMFKGLFGDSWGEWLEYLLKNAMLALTLEPHGTATLPGVERMLQDSGYRRRILAGVRDPVVAGFWRRYFEELGKKAELDRISSTLNKVGKFSLSPVLRNIVGQSKSGFDIARVMDTRQILIVNLAKGKIGADNANFLGSLIVSKIVSTALRRSSIPEAARVPFYLHIDEFQNVTSDEFTTIVSEARKYALSLTIAHQNFDQVPRSVLAQITKDAGTLIVFKVAFGDSDHLETAFRPLRREELETTHDGEFWVRTAGGSAELVRGYAPEALDAFRTSSFERVRRNSRWRFSRPREVVERQFAAWYGGKAGVPRRGRRIQYFER